MTNPNELRNEDFEHAVRGYNIDEVDEYVAYLKDEYTELYDAKKESDRKLSAALAKLEEYKQKEAQINKLRLEARDIGNALIAKTKEKCTKMISDAEAYAAEVNRGLDLQIKEKKNEVKLLSDSVIEFRDKIFDMYGKHIESLQKMTEAADRVAREVDNK